MKLYFKNVSIVAFVFALAFASFGLVSVNKVHAANTIVTKAYLDANTNGTVEKIRWVMDENVTACAYEAGDWTVNTAGSINVAITGLSCTGSDTNLDILVTADANETGGSTAPIISYANVGTAGSVTLTSGVMTAKASQSITDGAAPVILTGVFTDNNNNGAVDRIIYTTTADTGMVCTAYTGNVDMTVNTAGTVVIARNASDSCATNGTSTFTITLATPGTVNTTGGATLPVVTYTQPGNGLEDGALNDVPTKSSLTLADSALPIAVTLTPTDTAKGISRTSALSVIFSEPMTTGSLTFATSPVVTYTPTWSNGDKTVSLAHSSFPHHETYTATISAATDAAAGLNSLYGMPFSWTFTTIGTPVVGSNPVEDASTTGTTVTTTTTNTTTTTANPGLTINSIPVTADALAQLVVTGTPTIPTVTVIDSDGSVSVITMTVTKKSSKANVMHLQEALNKVLAMKLSKLLVVDGKWGGKTEAAIKLFQKENGLKADGIFGAKSRAKMNVMLEM